MRIVNRIPLTVLLLPLIYGCVASCQPASQPSSSGGRILNALQYGGSGSVDLGVRITAADAVLGTSCGTIEVPPHQPGLTVGSNPKLGSCHSLWLRSPIAWGHSTGPSLSSNTVILGDGAAAIQTLPPGAWITAQNLSHIRIENLWVTNPNTTDKTNVLFQCGSCTNLIFQKNHLYAEGGIWTGTTSKTYSSGSMSVSSQITVSNNFLDGGGNQVTLALLQYTQHVTEANNQTRNALYGTQWWGGDAKADGAVGNTRWVEDINISNNTDVNVRAAEWGSMGQDVTVTGVVADGCSDVCLDAEGSYRVNFSGFKVHNSANGGLATYYLSRHVTFGPGTVTNDKAAGYQLFHLYNSSQDPKASYDIALHNVTFNCRDTSNFCVGYIDPIGGVKLTNNTFLNSYFSSAGTNISGFNISGNRFTYSFASRTAFSAIAMSGLSGAYSSQNEISHNQFQSTPTQPAGIYAINIVSNDSNYSDVVLLQGNSTSGFTNDATLIAGSGNPSIKPTFILRGNSFGANSVTESITGAHGAFHGDQNLTRER